MTTDKPRIFLGSSAKQKRLVGALTRGLEGVARVDPWTDSFEPGKRTIDRLIELTREVDFAAFVFAQDDWTAEGANGPPSSDEGQASPRDNVVFEAGLFGGALGMNRTFILHANGAKLPTDFQGLTCLRYNERATEADLKTISRKLREAIEREGRLTRAQRSTREPAVTPAKMRALIRAGKVPRHYAVAKSDGNGAVQAWIALLPEWQAAGARRVDAVVTRHMPDVHKAVRWHGAWYGVPGRGWFLAMASFKAHLKLVFLDGASLRPQPPIAMATKPQRALDLHEDDAVDERRLAAWVRQARRLPGWGKA